MKLSDFDYLLPESLIAQHPAKNRDESRLLQLSKKTGRLSHLSFSDFPALLCKGDLLVLNNTKVFKARLFGVKESGGRAEILLERPLSEVALQKNRFVQTWSCLLRASRRLRPCAIIHLPEDGEAKGVAPLEGSSGSIVQLSLPCEPSAYLERVGQVPLPAYIKREESAALFPGEDAQRYQTIFAEIPGAIAAPTAGLHFTREILKKIENRGIQLAYVTLHVGSGTFLPVRTENIQNHVMHEEFYEIKTSTAEAIEKTRRQGGRVVAGGTTVVRTLESAWKDGRLCPSRGFTNLFIRPGYSFQVVDALLTNFHLPRSTLLMLVSAFASRELVLEAYRKAVQEKYRFFSFGDAMFLAD